MSTDNDVNGEKSLLQYLDLRQLNCLNEDQEHTLRGILEQKSRNTSETYLLSDADEQLLINIPFNQSVRVRGLAIQTSIADQAPKLIKILTNRPSLGFEDVEDADEPTVAQIVELTPEDVRDGKSIVLRYVRFQAVNSIHIFVASNQGESDATRIDAIDIFGTTVETTKSLSELNKQES